jgi:transcriptional regulator of nitric oxide reductase
MKKEWLHPFWENYQKDRITVKLVIKHDDGKVSSSTAKVQKYGSDGKVNPDWTEILEQNTIQSIDKHTEEREERHRKRREAQKIKQKEREQSDKLARLFDSKLEVFEIEAVKNSTNRKLKAKMRKSKNSHELMAYTTILIMEEMKDEQKETTV